MLNQSCHEFQCTKLPDGQEELPSAGLAGSQELPLDENDQIVIILKLLEYSHIILIIKT